MLAFTGDVVAARRGEPVSAFPFTDDEGELRHRAWRFLVPAHERAWFDRALAELAAKRVLPPGTGLGDPAAYLVGLERQDGISPASRYRRLGEDAAADAILLPPLVDTARRVAIADGVRMKTLAYTGDALPPEIADAEARVAENRCLLAWVRSGLEDRIAAYDFALRRLVIATPQADAVPAEHSLATLRAARSAFAGFDLPSLASCAGDRPIAGGRPVAKPPGAPTTRTGPLVARG